MIHFSSGMKVAIEKERLCTSAWEFLCAGSTPLCVVVSPRTLTSDATSRQPYQFKAHRSICMALHIQDQGTKKGVAATQTAQPSPFCFVLQLHHKSRHRHCHTHTHKKKKPNYNKNKKYRLYRDQPHLRQAPLTVPYSSYMSAKTCSWSVYAAAGFKPSLSSAVRMWICSSYFDYQRF